ncbi:MAG: methionine--tRNA ligase [Deltaproteobacteria bacterium]|nr:methionine--tRNA ligase [Deltaproteobacteria bacterium]
MSASQTKRTLVTAALPYSNGRLHVGHIAGAFLPADIYVRFLRLKGVETRFVCGSDDHGVAIMLTAEKEGRTPKETALYYSQKQKASFDGLNIKFDVYGGTSRTANHYKTSQDFFTRVYEKGYFEKQSTRQFFDASKDMFLPDRYVTGTCAYCKTPDQNGDQCENCGKMLDVDSLLDARSVMSKTPATVKESAHWFLDLSRFEKEVATWLESSTLREHTRNYVSGLLSTGLVKRAMTRDLTWGIPVPLQDPDAKGKVLYVWFDAPIGYISNTKELCEMRGESEEKYADWWKSDDCDVFHFIGEDNTIFHCVIWIAMLSAEGSFKLPKGVIVNQFLNIQFPGQDQEKISKSRGTAVWIEDYIASGANSDVLRFYLTSIAPERARTVYKPEDLVQRNNSELANVLGNFVHRIVSFTHKYFGPQVPEFPAAKVNDTDRAFEKRLLETHEKLTQHLEGFAFKQGLETIMEFCRDANKYVDEKAPWTTRKTDMELTAVSLAYGLRAIRYLSVALAPYMPDTAAKISKTLCIDTANQRWDDALKALPAGSPLAVPEILFSKIEDKEEVPTSA